MPLTPMQEIKQRLIELGMPRNHIGGCTDAQIEEILRAQNVARLPELYIDFLRQMGRGAGIYLNAHPGNYYPDLLTNRTGTLELMKEAQASVILPEDAFVFYCGDYEFFFFQDWANSADPDYYEYQEGHNVFVHHPSLLEFYRRSMIWIEKAFMSK